MHTDPDFHPPTLETHPDMAADPDTGGAMLMGRVKLSGEVPCSDDFDPDELRFYAGVDASMLAELAPEFLKLRIHKGVGDMMRFLWKLPRGVQHALYIYSRVKAALKKLREPITLELRTRGDGTYVPRYPVYTDVVIPQDNRSEDVTIPREDWAIIDTARGHDVRGTSMVWVERRVRKARTYARSAARRKFIKDQALTRAEPSQSTLLWNATERRRRNAARLAYLARATDGDENRRKPQHPLSPTYGEIWPPVPVPQREAVAVTVKAVPARAPNPTMDEIDPVIGIEHTYCDYSYSHGDYVASGPKWLLPSLTGEQTKPP